MKRSSKWTRAVHAVVAGFALAMIMVDPAAAYVGPGAGLTAIGAILAVIATLFLAVVGFVWYPVKRLLRKRNSAGRSERRGRAAQALADD
jgi:predicted MFS family arabinose efflux permease